MAETYDWKREHDRLWETLVPSRGSATTLQGELVRIAGKLTDEAYRNGNINWNEECETMWRFVYENINDSKTFTAQQRAGMRDAVEAIIRNHASPDLSGEGSPYYLMSERVVDWCMAHPVPIKLPEYVRFSR
jgi:hypothetical protein